MIAEFDPNFEVKSSYLIRVRSTDAGGLFTEKELTITINDLNLAPSDLTLSGSKILENTFVGTTIGTFIGTDDGEDNGALTYSLACTTGSVDDAKFSILGSTLRTATTINFESGATLSICVKVSDGVLSLDKNFTIDIGNVNESPYNFIFTQNSFDENTATGFLVGNLSSQDEDTGDTHIYDFGSGLGSTDNSSFTMSGAQVYASFSPNYENKNLYQVKFKVTDSGGITTDLQNTVVVNDLNEAPNDSFTYTLVAGVGSDNNGSFSISRGNLVANFTADYETKNSYTVRIRTTDNLGLFTEKQFIISIGNVSEGSSGGGGGGGGGYALYKDDCPSGDYSPSYYDKNCGTKPKTGSGTTTGTGKTNTGSTMTGSTSTGSTGTSFEEKVEKIIDNTFKDIKFEDENGEEFVIRKTVTGQFVVKKVDGDYEDKVFPKVDDAKKYINALTKFE
ncbi:hypothetical protein EOM39_04695, partial [Candidatus Gracilibacteria bacterium]|nr:hypothetical protein [Candidatus Gracilibacteria bacterium]